MKSLMKNIFTITIATFIFSMFFSASVYAGEIYLPDHNKKTLIMNPSATVKVYETTSPNYYNYINGRFAYSMIFPTSFSNVSEAGNSAGATFTNIENDSCKINVWGAHNLAQTSLSDSYFQKIKTIGSNNIIYSTYIDDYYFIYWIKNDIVFIDKVFISPNYINGFSFSYPASLDNQYSKFALALSDKFIPGWKTGFKIKG